MTQQIELQATPNQSLSVTLDDARYDLTIKETIGTMSVDIVRDNIPIMTGARLVAGTPFLPYRYQETGNFIITTEAGEIPYYTRFNVSQFLIYISVEELAA